QVSQGGDVMVKPTPDVGDQPIQIRAVDGRIDESTLWAEPVRKEPATTDPVEIAVQASLGRFMRAAQRKGRVERILRDVQADAPSTLVRRGKRAGSLNSAVGLHHDRRGPVHTDALHAGSTAQRYMNDLVEHPHAGFSWRGAVPPIEYRD